MLLDTEDRRLSKTEKEELEKKANMAKLAAEIYNLRKPLVPLALLFITFLISIIIIWHVIYLVINSLGDIIFMDGDLVLISLIIFRGSGGCPSYILKLACMVLLKDSSMVIVVEKSLKWNLVLIIA